MHEGAALVWDKSDRTGNGSGEQREGDGDEPPLGARRPGHLWMMLRNEIRGQVPGRSGKKRNLAPYVLRWEVASARYMQLTNTQSAQTQLPAASQVQSMPS